MNVVGDGAGKSQYHGYHCRGHVDVDARPADDAETDEQSEHRREQWCNHAAQRTGYDEHHNDGDDEGKEEQPPQFAFEINEFLVAQIGHSRGVGRQFGVFRLPDDVSRFFARNHVGRNVARLFPHAIFGERPQFHHNPRHRAVI